MLARKSKETVDMMRELDSLRPQFAEASANAGRLRAELDAAKVWLNSARAELSTAKADAQSKADELTKKEVGLN